MTDFTQPITLFNPFADSLHIREVYTTENFLSLSGAPLRNSVSSLGDSVGSSDEDILWVVPPGDRKEIITVSASGSKLMNGVHKGFVHIKTDHDNMIIPIELVVLLSGIHAVPESLDFGVLTAPFERRHFDLWLTNSGKSHVFVTEVVPRNTDQQLQVFMQNNPVLSPNGVSETLVATVVYTAGPPGKVSGELLVMTNDSNLAMAVLEVPYDATVLYGGVGHNDLVFLIPALRRDNAEGVQALSNDSLSRSSRSFHDSSQLVLANYFSAPVQLLGVVVSSCTGVMSVTVAEPGGVASSFERWQPMEVTVNVSDIATEFWVSEQSFLPKTCWLEVQTNISVHRIPVHLVDGRLEVQFMDAVCAIKFCFRQQL